MTDIIVGSGGEVKSFFDSLNELAAGILGLGATSEARGKWFCSATHVPLALFDVLFTLNDRTARSRSRNRRLWYWHCSEKPRVAVCVFSPLSFEPIQLAMTGSRGDW